MIRGPQGSRKLCLFQPNIEFAQSAGLSWERPPRGGAAGRTSGSKTAPEPISTPVPKRDMDGAVSRYSAALKQANAHFVINDSSDFRVLQR